MNAHGHITTNDGVALYYEVHGQGEVSFIVPAACFLSLDWQPLTQWGRVIFYDQRNRGNSFYHYGEQAEVGLNLELADIDALRQHFNLERFVLIGWSYLGAMTALYAARYRSYVERLVMIGAISPRPRQNDQDDAAYQAVRERSAARVNDEGRLYIESLRAQKLDSTDPEYFCREYRRIFRPANMYNLDRLARMKNDPCQYENEHPDRVSANFKALYSDFGDFDWRPDAQNIACPTLLIHGEEDLVPLAGAQEWAAHIPDSRLHTIPECAHFAWLEAPDTFWSLMQGFLKAS